MAGQKSCMIKLNDYLYDGDTIFHIIQNYARDLELHGSRTGNAIDIDHSNFLRHLYEPFFFGSITNGFPSSDSPPRVSMNYLASGGR